MSATNSSVLKSLEIDSTRVESLSEPDLCELIGFIEYDSRLHSATDDPRSSRRDESHATARATATEGAGLVSQAARRK
jgi:hypothetical protein